MNPRRYRVGLGQSDPYSTVEDPSQIRQSYFDPMTDPSPDNAPVDPSTGMATVTVTGHSQPKPLWPLLIVLALVGYVLFWGGQQKA
jgi:hypothetical protein